YRSRVRIDFPGDASFAQELTTFGFIDQGARLAITIPDNIALEVMARPHPQLELDAELDCVLWTTFNDLLIDFDRPTIPDRVIEHGSVNPFVARLGAEWR